MSTMTVPTKPAHEALPLNMKEAEDKLKRAKVQLILMHPFMAQVVMQRKITISPTVSTAYVTPRGYITVGAKFLQSLTVQQAVHLLAHEAFHFVLMHGMRRSWRVHSKWNTACDAVINDILVDSRVGDPIPGGVYVPGSKDKTAEQVYDEMPEDGGKGGKGGTPGGPGQDDGDGDYTPGEGQADLEEEELSSEESRTIEQTVRIELSQAAQVAKQQGKLSAALMRIVEEIVNPPTPWHQLLERYMTGFVKQDYSWSRPAKRMVEVAYLPSCGTVPSMGTIAVVIDTSGSIGQKELSHFLGHINRILETCNPERMIVIECDARVGRTTEYTVDDLPIRIKEATGGGGTDFRPPFKWLEEHEYDPEVVVYLTDMYGSFPKSQVFETVWLSTSGVNEAPFGEVIQYEITD